MTKTFSQMVALGTLAPDFLLTDVTTGESVGFDHHEKRVATVVAFICNHCPYVKHINPEFTKLAREYQAKGVQFFAINSNNVEQYPDDSPEHMKKTAQEQHYPFPYLFDETQEVAHAYHAVCTPDFFVYDANHALVYRGQFDDSRPGNHIKPNGNSIRIALDCLLNNDPIPEEQKPGMGCNIKWKE